MDTIHLYPADMISPRKVDGHFATEAQALRELGRTVKLVDLDALERGEGNPLRAWLDADAPTEVVYRGWMIKPAGYRILAERLGAKGYNLRTSADAYRRAHELPGWYEQFRDYTPRTVEIVPTDLDSLGDRLAELGAVKVFVKDYTKSLKGDPAASVIQDATDLTSARGVVERFISERGEYLAGAVLLREFEDFVGDEIRTWWIDGELHLVTAHPDRPRDVPGTAGAFISSGFSAAVKASGLGFITADFAQRSDGAWRLVEIGDGQVSDRPVSTPPEQFVSALWGS